MALLGPAPAVRDRRRLDARRRRCARGALGHFLDNVATYATFPLVGGAHRRRRRTARRSAQRRRSASPASSRRVHGHELAELRDGRGVARGSLDGVRTAGASGSSTSRCCPSEFASGLLTAGVAFFYGQIGLAAVGLLAVVLFVFQYLLRACSRRSSAARSSSKRTRELARSRSACSARCCGRVDARPDDRAPLRRGRALLARDRARCSGSREREQELVHTAALLHDIGKFIFPDSILIADRKLTDEEWKMVKLHPQQGAKLVRRIEGYGPVADIILGHHERIDGKGYPRGLAGERDPARRRGSSPSPTPTT